MVAHPKDYNSDLKMAAAKQELYLDEQSRTTTVSATVTPIRKKRNLA